MSVAHASASLGAGTGDGGWRSGGGRGDWSGVSRVAAAAKLLREYRAVREIPVGHMAAALVPYRDAVEGMGGSALKETWIETVVDGYLPEEEAYLVRDAEPEEGSDNPSSWVVTQWKVVPFPLPEAEQDFVTSNKVLAQWPTEDSEWTSEFYTGTVVANANQQTKKCSILFERTSTPKEVDLNRIVVDCSQKPRLPKAIQRLRARVVAKGAPSSAGGASAGAASSGGTPSKSKGKRGASASLLPGDRKRPLSPAGPAAAGEEQGDRKRVKAEASPDGSLASCGHLKGVLGKKMEKLLQLKKQDPV